MFRRVLLTVIVFAVSACWPRGVYGAPGAETVLIKGHPAHSTRLLARRAAPTGEAAHAAALAATGLRVLRSSALVPGLVVLETETAVATAQATTSPTFAPLAALPADEALLARLEALRASGLYDYVEPDYLVFPEAEPNDARYTDGTLWALRNSGINGGIAGVDIDAARAWDVSTGSEAIIVAVIDTGIRTTHLELASQSWRNPGEIPGNGIDDDHNGYVDDVFGIDAILGSGNPADLDGHGTHVAGTIGAAANDGNPHVGVAWNVRLMACRFLGANGGLTSDAVECIDYAVAHGASILNNSWGGGGYSRALYDSIAAAGARGVLFVAAAGNEGANTDAHPRYPGGFDLSNILTVASHDADGTFSLFSNYGRDAVDLVAPGRVILSCSNVGDAAYLVASGTSMAAPHASGVAVLVAAHFPGIAPADLRDRVINSALPIPAYMDKVASGGRLSAYRALTLAPDGQLEVAVTPGGEMTVFSGRAVTIVARVTDLTGVTGASVSARVGQPGTEYVLRDDGVASDAVAGDANYTGAFVVPAVQGALEVVVTATAAGKTEASRMCTYYVLTPPANDDFANRSALLGKADSVSVSTYGATAEAGEPAHAGRPAAASVWWTWTAPDTTTATVSTADSSFDTLLAVYQGNSLAALQLVAGNDDASPEAMVSEIQFAATRGETYQIALDGYDGATGPAILRLRTAIGPANDLFANAGVLSGVDVAFVGNLYNATREAGEPLADGGEDTGSIWWQWTAPAGGTVEIMGAVSAIGVYTGTAVESLTAVHLSPEGSSSGVDMRFSAIAGTVYRIAVSGRPTVASIVEDFSMHLALRDAPVNDQFANRAVLGGASASVASATDTATLESGEPTFGFNTSKASLWWTWTAPASGAAIFGVADGGSHGLGVYSGDSFPSLTLLASTAGGWSIGGTRYVTITATAGQTYQIQILGGRAPFTLSLDLRDAPPNDTFAERIQIAGSQVDFGGNTTGATREVGEPAPTAYGSGRSLWWSWTPPWTGTATIKAGEGDGVVAVYIGDSLDALQRVSVPSSDMIPNDAVFRAVAGVEYKIWVDGLFSHMGVLRYALKLELAPANDMFADRIALEGDLVQVVATTAGATVEPGESYGTGRRHTIWWSWTAGASGPVQFTTSPWAVHLDVSTGSALNALMRVGASFGSRGGVNFDAIAGTTYVIQASTETEFQNLPLTIYSGLRPANDNFADRTPLAGTTVQATGANRGATAEGDEPSNGTWGRGQTVWWTWTAPADGPVVVDTKGSDFDTALAVRTGSVLGSTVSIASNDDDPAGGVTSRLAFVAEAGVEYHIVVDSRMDETGSIVLNLSQRPPPGNDMFAARTVVSGSKVTQTGDAFGAGREAGEPALSGTSPSSTVWFEWTPPYSGVAVVTVKDCEFDPVIGVFTGSALGSLSPIENLQPFQWTNRMAFRADPLVTYQIGVGSRSGPTGRFALSIELESPPVNDDFAQRILLSGTSVTGESTTVGTSREPGEPLHAGLPVNCTVWWTWTAPLSGTFHLNTLGSEAGVVLGVYTGGAVGSLTQVASVANSANGNRLDLAATGGVSYHFALAHLEGANGPVNLTIHDGVRPANDDFASAIALTGLEVETTGHNRAGTSEAGEPSHGGAAGDTSVWWTWTAPLSARVLVATAGSNCDTLLAVYRGDSLAGLVAVGANDDAASGTRASSMIIDAEQGSTYRIAVTGVGGAMGDIALSVIAGVEPISVGIGGSAFTVAAGDGLEIEASAYGTGPLAYQWYRDDVELVGATDAALRLRCAQTFQAGAYTVRVLNVFGETVSAPMAVAVTPPPASDARVLNLSTRALCQTGENVLIPGFYVEGAGTKRLLMRAVGPELGRFGVGNALPDPQLVLRRASDKVIVASNDDWGDGPADDIREAGRSVYAFGLTDGSTSAALLLDLPAGGYTITASGKGEETGVSIVELYEIPSAGDASRLINISNRGYVGIGGNIMIPGFVVSEEGARTFLVRVVGPSLSKYGVQGVLGDPKLEIYKRRPGTAIDDLILTNDTWGENGDAATIRQTATAVHAFSLLEGSADAAFVVTLPPGAYTVNAKGVGDTTGVALVEVYLVP